jgi:hypothetical protein
MSLLSDNTGVIVLPPFRDLTDSTLKLSYREYDARLLFFLLYFDRIRTVPLNVGGFSPITTSTELEQTLVEQGAIEGTVLFRQIRQPLFDDQFILSLARPAYEQLNGAGDGSWALALPESARGEVEGQANCMVAVLQRCLPCPTPDVPVHEVLDFKERHRPELLRLQAALDRCFFGLLGGLDEAAARQLFETEVQTSIQDVNQAFAKEGFRVFHPDLEISLRLPLDLLPGLLPIVGGAAWGEFGTIAGLVGSMISVRLAKSYFATAGNAYPRGFAYLLGGLRKAIMRDRPDDPPFETDIEIEMVDNVFSTVFVRTPTPPVYASGSSFKHNKIA